MRKQSRSYKTGLHQRLRNIQHAAIYVNAALEDNAIEGFLLALRDVAEATTGIGALAGSASVNRENLYRMLSESGNPRLDSLKAVLEALQLRLSVVPMSTGPEADESLRDELSAMIVRQQQ